MSAADTTSAPQAHADRLGETLRLATAIADDSARCDIECHCVAERMGQHTWYDKRCPTLRVSIDDALASVLLRWQLERGWYDAKTGEAV